MIWRSFGSQPSSVSRLAKHFCSTSCVMNAAVEAPGEAPSRATSVLSLFGDDLGAELQVADPALVRLYDLHALPGHRLLPIVASAFG